MDITQLIVGDLTPDQLQRLRQWQKATEAIADILFFGEMGVKFHAGRVSEYHLQKKLIERTPVPKSI